MMSAMGLLKKLLQGADKAYDAKEALEHKLLRDRRFDRAESLAATGDPNTAVVTGIRRRLNDSTTETDIRLEWFAPEPRVGAIHYGNDLPLLIRLGSTIAIKADGDSAVVDPAAMANAPGAPRDAGRRSRKVPEPGMDDRALDARVLSRITKWAPQDATVESFEQTQVFGMLTENWNIAVTGADGSRATVSKDNVPPYARWYVVPGAVVPILTDPKDPGRAQINWPELAERRAVAGSTWQERPPEGSIAASVLTAGSQAEPAPATSMGETVDTTPSAESVDAIEGITIERCASIEAALSVARIPPAAYDDYAATNLGVPAGRWGAIRSQWETRQRADWRVGAAYGEAYETAVKELKKKR
jgi:hypothetical protein